MSFLLHFLRAEDVFVDVGANVGAYTVLASAVAGARSIAIEPTPVTYGHLRDNVALNGIESLVELKKCRRRRPKRRGCLHAIARHPQPCRECPPPRGNADVIEVRMQTLDDVVGARAPILIKIDVEGFERFVLAGAARTLASTNLMGVIIETNESGLRYNESDATLHDILTSFGFGQRSYDPLTRTLTSSRNSGRNTLYLRDDPIVEKRLTEAPPFTANGRSL